MSVIFKGVAYTSINELVKDVYSSIYLKLGKSIFFEPLLTIYKNAIYNYRGELIYEEDIEDEKKFQIASAEAIQLAKDAVSYITSFPEYTIALDIKFGNDDSEEYDGDLLQKIKTILKNTKIMKMLTELIDLIDYHDIDIDTEIYE